MNKNFSFPFKPYDIQEKFMKELYNTIENEKLGIFESPTGTGKSLSICCSAFQWLKDYNERKIIELKKEIDLLRQEMSLPTTNDWLQEEYEKIKKNQQLAALVNKLAKIKIQNENYEAMKVRVEKAKRNVIKNKSYFTNKELLKKTNINKVEDDEIGSDNINEEDLDLMLEQNTEQYENSNEEVEPEIVQEENDDITKLYISSRTHSQLSQFVGEIKKTIFKEDTKVVTLASRQHYCINSDVSRLKNVNLINERCLDLQKSKSKTTLRSEEGKSIKKSKSSSCKGCPYYNQNTISELKDHILVNVMDVEDIVKCGKQLKACPYYASRMALDDAEVVLVSHAGIVSSGARSGIQLKLSNNVLILDEAHALTSALEQAHSAPVSLAQLQAVHVYLTFYIKKYSSRFNSKNLLSINQVLFVVGRLLNVIQANIKEEDKQDTSIFTLEDFVLNAEIDHLNLRPLVQFCRQTKLAPKLHGFSLRYDQITLEEEMNKINVKKNKSSFEKFLNKMSKNNAEEEKNDCSVEEVKVSRDVPEVSPGSSMYCLLEFLERLCDRSANGRVLAQRSAGCANLKYLLLNPAEHFMQVVNQCRSVIVAGGTMEPISEFTELLLGTPNADSFPSPRLTVLRCGHVVSSDNVLAVCLSKGPTNRTLNFSYENRLSTEVLDEVCGTLRNVCGLVRGGVVCFLPSYTYEAALYAHMLKNNVIEAIAKKKTIFREPKSAAEVDKVLNAYSACIRDKMAAQNGALMLSVVGGKLSEGLNFSDELGRCIIVVGLPYPNIKSPELQQKLQYLSRKYGSSVSNQYYESLCMKAVNQCIGRAVRHADDFACVLLLDERYSRPHTVSALPSFVQKSLNTNCSFGPTVGSIAKFFAKHKTK